MKRIKCMLATGRMEPRRLREEVTSTARASVAAEFYLARARLYGAFGSSKRALAEARKALKWCRRTRTVSLIAVGEQVYAGAWQRRYDDETMWRL